MTYDPPAAAECVRLCAFQASVSGSRAETSSRSKENSDDRRWRLHGCADGYPKTTSRTGTPLEILLLDRKVRISSRLGPASDNVHEKVRAVERRRQIEDRRAHSGRTGLYGGYGVPWAEGKLHTCYSKSYRLQMDYRSQPRW